MLIIITGTTTTTLGNELLASLENASIFESPRYPHADWLKAVRGAMADASHFISVTKPENIRATYKATMGQAVFIHLRGDGEEKEARKQVRSLQEMGIAISIITASTPAKILGGVVAIIKKKKFLTQLPDP